MALCEAEGEGYDTDIEKLIRSISKYSNSCIGFVK